MAHYNEQQLKNMNNHSERFKYVKKMTQILLPLSFFSLLFSHSSSLAPLLVESYDYLVSELFIFNFNFKFKLFTYTTERNCIFLLCNGILVFIIQSSGLISKITPLDSGPKTARTYDHRAEKEDENAARFEENKKKGSVGGKVEVLEEKNSDDLASKLVEEDLKNCEVEKWVEDDDEDDDAEIDTEELKRKCEDFIKKVKLEIQGA